MTSKRLFFVFIGALCLLVVSIFGGVYAVNKTIENKSDNLVSLKAKQQSLQQEQAELIQMKKDIVAYNSLYQISQLIVPQNKDQTETVRQIVKLAQENDVTLQTITYPASSLGTGASPLALNAGTPASTGVAQPVGIATNPALSQLTPVTNIPGVYDLQITVASANESAYLSTYPQMIGFLSGLEQNRLTAQVSSIDISPSTTVPGHLSFTLTLDVFIKPEVAK